MIISWLILTLTLAVVLFCFHETCQSILGRQFDQEYFRSIAKATRLEFPCLRDALKESGASFDYSRLPNALKCDFFALTHLLKNAAGPGRGDSKEQRLLILYFRVQFLSLVVSRLLGAGEKKAALRLASVLQYFANVVGQRVNEAWFGYTTAACSLINRSFIPPCGARGLDLPLRAC